MKLPRVLSSARQELVLATEHYLNNNREVAADFVDRVETAFAEIGTDPWRFPRLETVSTDREIRRVLLSRFPYLVVYEIYNEEPCVLALAHASRRPDYWLERTESRPGP